VRIIRCNMPPKYYNLIEKTLGYFNLRSTLAARRLHVDEAAYQSPFITVAREPGSGGAPIAQAVAEKLQFEFVDEQIVEEVASSTKKRKAVIQEVDEKSRSKINDMVHSMLNVEYVDESEYITEMVRVIMAYAHRGHCVILGRGGNFITPFTKGLHVSITAPLPVRLRRAMDFEGLSERQALAVIEKVENERRQFVQQYFNSNIKKRNVFDITLNTEHFTVAKASNVIVEAFRQKFS
jgi:cytidylate kinase